MPQTTVSGLAVFDSPVHAIRQGHTYLSGGRYFTYVRGHDAAVELHREAHALLSSLDAATSQVFTGLEHLVLLWLADLDLVALIPESAALTALDMVPVSRRPMKLVVETEDGYIIRTKEGDPFTLSELPLRFLFFVDGRRTVAEIAALVGQGVLADPDDRAAVEQVQARGSSLDAVLLGAAYALISQMSASGAMTFEPSAPNRNYPVSG